MTRGIKWRARYRKNEDDERPDNPFGLRFSAKLAENADVVAKIPANISSSLIAEMARAATPEGYIFISVEEVMDF